MNTKKKNQNILRAKNSKTFESLIRKLSSLQTITIPFLKYQIENFHTKYFPTQLQVFLTHTHLPLLTAPHQFSCLSQNLIITSMKMGTKIWIPQCQLFNQLSECRKTARTTMMMMKTLPGCPSVEVADSVL